MQIKIFDYQTKQLLVEGTIQYKGQNFETHEILYWIIEPGVNTSRKQDIARPFG